MLHIGTEPHDEALDANAALQTTLPRANEGNEAVNSPDRGMPRDRAERMQMRRGIGNCSQAHVSFHGSCESSAASKRKCALSKREELFISAFLLGVCKTHIDPSKVEVESNLLKAKRRRSLGWGVNHETRMFIEPLPYSRTNREFRASHAFLATCKCWKFQFLHATPSIAASHWNSALFD